MYLLKLTMILCIVTVSFHPLFTYENIYSEDIDTKLLSMKNTTKIKTKNDNFQQITKKDDAYHGTTPYPSMEWWYFDGIFDNNYSMHLGFRILSFHNFQILKPSINIYQNSDLIAHETILIPKKYFFTSETLPLLKIKNNSVMEVHDSNKSKNDYLTYHIDYKLNKIGVYLEFKGVTEGWKYETLHEGWTVALPQATINGSLFLDDETISVHGTGYHDHNWNFGLKTPARGWAWYWGKIRSEHYGLSWANIKKTGILEQTFRDRIGVLNTINGSFDVIDSDNISFSAEAYITKNARRIPTKFHIYAKQNDILIDLFLETTSIHRTDPSAFTMHYWRYFVKASGMIKKGDTIDEFQNVPHIMEFMRFI